MKNNVFVIIVIIILIICNIMTSLFLYYKIDFLEYKNEEKDKDTLIIQIIFSIIENDTDFLINNFDINLNNLIWKDKVKDEFYIIKDSIEYYVYFKNDFVLYIDLEKNLDKNKKYRYKLDIGEITGGEGKTPYNQYPKGRRYYFIGKYRIYG